MNLERLQSDWARYGNEQERYRRASADVAAEVRKIAKALGLPCRTTGREKTLSEFLKKAVRRRDDGYLDDPWGKIDDKAGARAIVQLEDQVDRLAQAIIHSGKLPLVGDPKDTRLGDPQQLEYRGLHLQVIAPREDADTEAIECELQVRTEAQDLWSSVVSHRLLYKPLVDVPAEVKRSLYRLVALIELFDEEVARAMMTIRQLEGYELYELLDLAEREYLSLSPSPQYDKGLSMQVLSAIAPAIATDVAVYAEALRAFAEERADDLRSVYAEYGAESDASEVRYLLLSQPESVILLERLSNAPEALVAAWQAEGLPESLLTAVAAVWAVDLGR